ncbi:TetR/AcrR family transcriptional regulator [Pasteurella testudinis]|uniref:TetR/AcrR family transcriptional regulator n=1 Tax=Pasteurella testudinis TaxID=761 RepID=UPI0040597873
MSKKRQLIESACQLFYQQGFHACGVEQLAQQAGITKRTLYRYFDSKEELIVATLAHRHQQFMAQMQAVLADYSLQETVEGYLFFLRQWILSENFYGCMFINACAEYADPQMPAHQQAKEHKQAVQAVLLARLQQAGLQQAENLAELLFISGEGIIVSAQTLGKETAKQQLERIQQNLNSLTE